MGLEISRKKDKQNFPCISGLVLPEKDGWTVPPEAVQCISVLLLKQHIIIYIEAEISLLFLYSYSAGK